MSDKFKINKITIGGIRNPQLNIFGEKDKNIKFFVVIDGIKYKLTKRLIINRKFVFNHIFYEDNSFNYYLNFPNKSKKLYIYAKSTDKEYLIYKKNVSYTKRVINRVFYSFKVLFVRVGRIPRTLLKVFKVLFGRNSNYNLGNIKQYTKSFINNIKNHNVNDLFYSLTKQSDYNLWLKQNDFSLENLKSKSDVKFTIIVNCYNKDEEYYKKMFFSIKKQIYTNYEVFFNIKEVLNKELYKLLVKNCENNFNFIISDNKVSDINKIINDASGEFVTFINCYDKYNVNYLNEISCHNNADFIYTDEDEFNNNDERLRPLFKPDWSPDTILSFNYINNTLCVKKKLLSSIDLFTDYYDLILKVTEKTNKIHHISKVLYYSSVHSSKYYINIFDNSYVALKNAIKRRNLNADVIKCNNYFYIKYKCNNPKISIIIPTKDKSSILSKCLESIYNVTDYKNFEIIVVDNGSVEEETKVLFKKYLKNDNFKVIKIDTEFNYSYLNNEAVKIASGDYIVLLNNDIEIITSSWLTEMVSYAMQDHIGCVGVKLLYPNRTIQHCGVILGLGGIAGHAYVGTGSFEEGYCHRLSAVYDWSAVTAACLMVKKSKFLKVGCLDENLKVAYNDVDLNIKMLNNGLYNVVLPNIVNIHYESISRGSDLSDDNKKRYVNEINYVVSKWKKEVFYDKYYNNNLSYNYPFVLEKCEDVYEKKDWN